MNLKTHIATAVCLSPGAYYFTDLRMSVLFGASLVLIDIDHYLHYVYRRKNLSIGGMFSFYDDIWDRRGQLFGIEFLHTAEVLLLLLAAGFWWPEFWSVAAGFVVHMLFDVIQLWRYNVTFMRALSIAEYFIRKKNYLPSMIW
jgi:hypothetical protein